MKYLVIIFLSISSMLYPNSLNKEEFIEKLEYVSENLKNNNKIKKKVNLFTNCIQNTARIDFIKTCNNEINDKLIEILSITDEEDFKKYKMNALNYPKASLGDFQLNL